MMSEKESERKKTKVNVNTRQVLDERSLFTRWTHVQKKKKNILNICTQPLLTSGIKIKEPKFHETAVISTFNGRFV